MRNLFEFDRGHSAYVEQAEASEEQLIERAKASHRDSALIVGECAAEWTRRYARGRSDAEFAERIGMSRQDVNYCRRVYERFGQSCALRRNISWTHHREALAWPNAEEILDFANTQKLSVAAMKEYYESLKSSGEGENPSKPDLDKGQFAGNDLEIPLPKPGERLMAFLNEDIAAIDVLEIVPCEDGEWYFVARFNLVENDHQYISRAVNRETIGIALKTLAPHINLGVLTWTSTPHAPLLSGYHPLCNLEDGWRGDYKGPAYWFFGRETDTAITAENVWTEVLKRADSDFRINGYDDSEIARIRTIVEEEFSQLERSAHSDARLPGSCPKCGFEDGQLCSRIGVCWQHRLCWMKATVGPEPRQQKDLEDYRMVAHLVLLEFFSGVVVGETLPSSEEGSS